MNLTYADGIAAALTTIVLEGHAAMLQRRLPSNWELTPFKGLDVRGRASERIPARCIPRCMLIAQRHKPAALARNQAEVELPVLSIKEGVA